MGWRWLICVALVSVGCAAAKGRADSAFARGDFVTAADAYGEAVDDTPGDHALAARRDDARARALVALAARVELRRRTGGVDHSISALAELLARHHRWSLPSPDVARGVIAAVAASATAIHDEIRALVADGRVLAAEHEAHRLAQELPFAELDTLWPALAVTVHQAGLERCQVALPRDVGASPYLAHLAAAYCAHFDVDVGGLPALPDCAAAMALAGDVAGMSSAQRDQVAAALDLAFRETPWFLAAAGEPQAHAQLDGVQAVAFSTSTIERTAPWSQAVHYTEREAYRQAYQEAYQESYQVSTPHTEWHTESYSCGFGSTSRMCSRQVSSTRHTIETRYRTAYRTAHRTAYRDVTRTRLEPRVYTYPALQRIGDYAGTWNLSLRLGPTARPLAIQIARTQRKIGYDHDEYFPAADVEPSRAALPSLDEWFVALLAELRATLPAKLRAHWSSSFCQRPSYGAEDAARCAFGASPPRAARSALVESFGREVDEVVARLSPASRSR